VAKSFKITERVSFRLSTDAAHSFNHTNLGLLISDVQASNAGQIDGTSAGGSMRRMQFSGTVFVLGQPQDFDSRAAIEVDGSVGVQSKTSGLVYFQLGRSRQRASIPVFRLPDTSPPSNIPREESSSHHVAARRYFADSSERKVVLQAQLPICRQDSSYRRWQV
jgi:hypothetical protein